MSPRGGSGHAPVKRERASASLSGKAAPPRLAAEAGIGTPPRGKTLLILLDAR